MKSKFQVDQINTMLKHLLMAYKYCNMYSTLNDLSYDPDREVVNASWHAESDIEKKHPYVLEINVACDSYAAMIHDVEQRVYKFFS